VNNFDLNILILVASNRPCNNNAITLNATNGCSFLLLCSYLFDGYGNQTSTDCKVVNGVVYPKKRNIHMNVHHKWIVRGSIRRKVDGYYDGQPHHLLHINQRRYFSHSFHSSVDDMTYDLCGILSKVSKPRRPKVDEATRLIASGLHNINYNHDDNDDHKTLDSSSSLPPSLRRLRSSHKRCAPSISTSVSPSSSLSINNNHTIDGNDNNPPVTRLVRRRVIVDSDHDDNK
jgi:hypothetical protein